MFSSVTRTPRPSQFQKKRKVREAPAIRSPAHASQQTILQEVEVYLMHNVPYFWVNKFGISFHPGQRRQNVSETTAGYVFYLVAPELEFGWQLELFIKKIYRFQNVHFDTGSGRTEWFLVFSPVVGTSAMFICYFYDLHLTIIQHAILYFCPFIWLDGLFWLCFFYALRTVVWASLGGAIIYALKSL